MSAATIPETCYRCGADTGEIISEKDAEYAGYCGPCRSEMLLPCDCGDNYDRSGRTPFCHTCGTICGYWDDSDLVDPDW